MRHGRITTCKESSGEVRCKQACPVGIDIPRYIRLIKEGKFAEAAAVVREKTPFPAALGRVCPRFCEEKCRRGEVDEPLAINALKRFAIEHDTGQWKQLITVAPATGKSVAVVGSGPAGLTAAYYLAKLGHLVTVFEALPEPGGMMRFGIPDYRLPKDILRAEIKEIEDIGVEIRANTRVDSIDKLLQEGYNAIFLAIGAHLGVKIGVEGEDSPRVMDAVSFLRDVSLGKRVELGDKVAVIGGGNAAIDSARTALRLGAKEVAIVYRRTRTEMPASPEEIEEALVEGVQIHFLAAPSRITSQDESLELQCIRTRLGAVDATGRRRPEPIKDTEFSMNLDTVIAAIGQLNVAVRRDNVIEVDHDSLATNREGVFAGGDAVRGPTSVIEAIADGRDAAASIDKYLDGKGIIDEVLAPAEQPSPWFGYDQSILDIRRHPMLLLPKSRRLASFAEVELGFTKEAAIEEASRCLRCDQQVVVNVEPDKCVECYMCQMICSLVYQGAFNIEKARIAINLPEISWMEECIGGCALCIQRCPSEAITLK